MTQAVLYSVVADPKVISGMSESEPLWPIIGLPDQRITSAGTLIAPTVNGIMSGKARVQMVSGRGISAISRMRLIRSRNGAPFRLALQASFAPESFPSSRRIRVSMASMA